MDSPVFPSLQCQQMLCCLRQKHHPSSLCPPPASSSVVFWLSLQNSWVATNLCLPRGSRSSRWPSGTRIGKPLSSRRARTPQPGRRPRCCRERRAGQLKGGFLWLRDLGWGSPHQANRTQQYMMKAPMTATALPSFWMPSCPTLG